MAVFRKRQEKNDRFDRDEHTTSPSMADNKTSEGRRSVVGKTLFIKGDVFSDEEVFIEGKIEGKLDIKHRVIIGQNGLVNADIEAREIIIKGTVNGNVSGSYKVEIVPNGVLNGNILSQRVVLAEGAVFKGNIDMTTKEKEKLESSLDTETETETYTTQIHPEQYQDSSN